MRSTCCSSRWARSCSGRCRGWRRSRRCRAARSSSGAISDGHFVIRRLGFDRAIVFSKCSDRPALWAALSGARERSGLRTPQNERLGPFGIDQRLAGTKNRTDPHRPATFFHGGRDGGYCRSIRTRISAARVGEKLGARLDAQARADGRRFSAPARDGAMAVEVLADDAPGGIYPERAAGTEDAAPGDGGVAMLSRSISRASYCNRLRPIIRRSGRCR